MFEDLRQYQLDQLTKVWEAMAKATHWRDVARNEMARAIAGGCTYQHLAAVTGLDVVAIERVLRGPRPAFNGQHPTDPTAPGQERFHR